MAASGEPPGVSPRESVWVWAGVAALLVAHFTLAWILRAVEIVALEDHAHYLLLANSLQDFQYRDIFSIGAPYQTRLPPFYPAVLAGWNWLVGGNFDATVALNILASCATLLLVFLVVQRLWSTRVALACLAALAFNKALADQAGTLYSEASFGVLSVAALAVGTLAPRWRHAVLVAGTAAICAALTRTVGITVVAALAVHWLLERRYRAVAGLVLGGLVFLGGWQWWVANAPTVATFRTYGEEIAFAGDRSAYGLFGLEFKIRSGIGVTLPGVLGVPGLPGTDFDLVPRALLTFAAMVTGAIALLRRWRPAALYIGAYGTVLIVWPWFVGRLLIPIVPFLVPALLLGLGAWAGRWRPGWRERVIVVAALGLTANGLIQGADLARDRRVCDETLLSPGGRCQSPDAKSFLDAVAYIRERLPEDAVLLNAKAQPLYYHTGRLTVPYSAGVTIMDPTLFLPYLREWGTTHVLLGSVDHTERGNLARLLGPTCGEFELLERFPPRTYLFRVRAANETSPADSAACRAIEQYVEDSRDKDFSGDI